MDIDLDMHFSAHYDGENITIKREGKPVGSFPPDRPIQYRGDLLMAGCRWLDAFYDCGGTSHIADERMKTCN